MYHAPLQSSDAHGHRNMNGGLWMWWFIAHAIAGIVGSGLWQIISWLWETAPAQYATLGEWMIRLAVLLFVLSLAQWLVLSLRVDIDAWWVLGTTVSGGIILPIIAEFVDKKLSFPKELVSLVGGGIIIGIVQWLLLRSHIRQAFWWMPAVALGWFGSLLIGLVLTTAVGIVWKWLIGGPLLQIVNGGILWAGYGALTGIVLVWLLRHKISGAPTYSSRA
jgi:hypothetical protein